MLGHDSCQLDRVNREKIIDFKNKQRCCDSVCTRGIRSTVGQITGSYYGDICLEEAPEKLRLTKPGPS